MDHPADGNLSGYPHPLSRRAGEPPPPFPPPVVVRMVGGGGRARRMRCHSAEEGKAVQYRSNGEEKGKEKEEEEERKVEEASEGKGDAE